MENLDVNKIVKPSKSAYSRSALTCLERVGGGRSRLFHPTARFTKF